VWGNEDLRRALELIHRVQSAPDLDEYRARGLDIRGLVDGHIVGYNEVDAATGETFALTRPRPATHGRARSRTSSPGRASRTRPLPRDLRPFGVEDRIALLLPAPEGIVIGVAINRPRRGFSANERELLEIVRPHLGQAFRDAAMRSSLDPMSDSGCGRSV
jgi:hypothetical protein